MKKTLLFFIIGIISLLNYSCIGGSTCTSDYISFLKIDGKQNDKVLIKYTGPKWDDFKNFKEFDKEQSMPCYEEHMADTYCHGKYFKKNEYNFLEITNLSSESVYICAVLYGPEIDDNHSYNTNIYNALLRIYSKQDKDPNYDYTKNTAYNAKEHTLSGVKFVYKDRYEFYEELIKEKYPYIIKLEPNKTCTMRWGGLGFKVL